MLSVCQNWYVIANPLPMGEYQPIWVGKSAGLPKFLRLRNRLPIMDRDEFDSKPPPPSSLAYILLSAFYKTSAWSMGRTRRHLGCHGRTAGRCHGGVLAAGDRTGYCRGTSGRHPDDRGGRQCCRWYRSGWCGCPFTALGGTASLRPPKGALEDLHRKIEQGHYLVILQTPDQHEVDRFRELLALEQKEEL